jgi:hypothetical protein
MIRRTFWLMAGAALGIAGYRRLTTLVNAGKGPRAVRVNRPAAGGFMRDVRAGMAEYMDRHSDA